MVRLEECTLFRRLGAAELARLRQVAQALTFRPGEDIFKEGDAGDGLYVLTDGKVEISVRLREGTRHVFSEVEPGEVFGEMAVVEDQPRSASAVACEPVAAYFVPRAEMLELVAASPALALALLREISGRLREFNRQHLRELIQAERLAVVGRFANSIIHDLKNPLNIIGLSAELVRHPKAPAEARAKSADTIRRQVDRISEMINEILEFTRGPQRDLVLVPVDYAELVRQVAQEVGAETALKGVTLELQDPLPEARPVLNPKRLRRVFHNLAANATDAMQEGGRIFIRCRVEPGQVVTEVEDTGPGIAPEMAGRLFEPFASHGKAHGTGLGLSICKRILEDHHGWITTRIEPGHGAIFTFGLPT
jgi:signal transduction histidine kinase